MAKRKMVDTTVPVEMLIPSELLPSSQPFFSKRKQSTTQCGVVKEPVAIKAIETEWKGYRFRSRLEARWAVFFEMLGLEWEYEKEGYDVNGRWYLPDFWIPSLSPSRRADGCGQWIEIKPSPEEIAVDDALFSGLAVQTGHQVYVIGGNPWQGEHICVLFQHGHDAALAGKILCGGFITEVVECGYSRLAIVSPGTTVPNFPFPTRSSHSLGMLDDAFKAARSARFEHGEKP